MFGKLFGWESRKVSSSSFVKKVSVKDDRLRIKLNKKTYEYRDVAHNVLEDLLSGAVDSYGKYYNKNVKGNF